MTTHPAFRNAARSFGDIYDRKRAPENVEATSYEEDGERYSAWYLKAATVTISEGERRRIVASGNWSYGLLGRSPDHVASFITGLTMNPESLRRQPQGVWR